MSDAVKTFLQDALADPSRLDAATILEALRISAEGVRRVADQGVEHGQLLKEMGQTLHSIDKRLTVLETGGVQAKVDDHEKRLAVLEAEENRRKGAIGLGGWIVKNWPALVGYVGLIVVMIEKGLVKL